MFFKNWLEEKEFNETLDFLSNIDSVTEDAIPILEELSSKLENEELNEGIRKFVIRHGKKIKKLFCPPGMQAKDGKRCVVIPGKLKTAMRRRARIAARKRKVKKSLIRRKMKIARRRRKSMGLV